MPNRPKHEPLAALATEAINPAHRALDQLPTLALLDRLNREDASVAAAVRGCLPAIAAAVDQMIGRYESGGRLIYVGAGTSGRMGALDAAEIPPTFGIAAGRVVGVIAGGPAALAAAVEGAEDDAAAGARDLRQLDLQPADCIVGIAASGRTPYTIAALGYARRRGCLTIAVAAVEGSPLAARAQIAIAAVTGPEAIAGSTRLKAGTAQKMILNLLSTALMVRTGHVRGNLMINLQATNAKLQDRAARILVLALGWTDPDAPGRARRLLRRAGGSVPLALLLSGPADRPSPAPAAKLEPAPLASAKPKSPTPPPAPRPRRPRP